jgi:hypothetical protein
MRAVSDPAERLGQGEGADAALGDLSQPEAQHRLAVRKRRSFGTEARLPTLQRLGCLRQGLRHSGPVLLQPGLSGVHQRVLELSEDGTQCLVRAERLLRRRHQRLEGLFHLEGVRPAEHPQNLRDASIQIRDHGAHRLGFLKDSAAAGKSCSNPMRKGVVPIDVDPITISDCAGSPKRIIARHTM